MKKKHRQFLKVALVLMWPVLLLSIGVSYSKRNVGFSIEKVRSDFAFASDLSEGGFAPSVEEFRNIKEITSQDFHYLSSGNQCYVFVSDDQEYVIKFFKMKHLTPKYWLNYLPLPWLEKYRFEKVEKRERVRKETFDSFRIGYTEMPQQTGLLFVHFQKTHYPQDKISVIDKVGKKHVISLNSVPFVLQRKAEMIYDHINGLMNKGQKLEAISALKSILELIKERSEKGLMDKDGGISGNYGFIGKRPVHIDIGQVVKVDSCKEPTQYLKEISRVASKMEEWLKVHHPEVCPQFQEEVEKMINAEEINSF